MRSYSITGVVSFGRCLYPKPGHYCTLFNTHLLKSSVNPLVLDILASKTIMVLHVILERGIYKKD